MNKKFIKLSGLVLAVLVLFSCAQAAGGDDTLDSGNKNVGGNTPEASFPYAKYRFWDSYNNLYCNYDLRRNSEQCSIRVSGNEVYIRDNVNHTDEYKFVWSTVGKDLYLSGYVTRLDNNGNLNAGSTDVFFVGKPNRVSNYNEEAKVLKLDFVSYDDNSSGDNGGGSGDSGSVSSSDLNGTWNYGSKTITFNNGTITRSDVSSSFSYSLSGSKLTVENNAEYTISISDNKLKIDAGNDTQNKQLLKTFFGYTGSDSYIELTK